MAWILNRKRITFLLTISFLIVACLNVLAGHIGVSQDIKKSKKRKVFIQKRPVGNVNYQINDTLIKISLG